MGGVGYVPHVSLEEELERWGGGADKGVRGINKRLFHQPCGGALSFVISFFCKSPPHRRHQDHPCGICFAALPRLFLFHQILYPLVCTHSIPEK